MPLLSSLFKKYLQQIPQDQLRITVATKITLMRLMLVPVVVVAMVLHQWGVAWLFFTIAAVTDVLDGGVARFFNERTFLGACLDPVVDKLLIIAVYTTLAFVQFPSFSIPVWFLILVSVKEVLLMLGVVWLVLTRGLMRIEPTFLGKATMVAHVCFCTWIFACYFFNWMPLKTYYGMLAIVLVLVGASLVQYGIIGLHMVRRAFFAGLVAFCIPMQAQESFCIPKHVAYKESPVRTHNQLSGMITEIQQELVLLQDYVDQGIVTKKDQKKLEQAYEDVLPELQKINERCKKSAKKNNLTTVKT